MKTIFNVLMSASLLLMQSSCSTTTFPPVGQVTRIEVRTNHNKVLKRITDKNQIAKITAFVDQNASGWGGLNDWAGVPVATTIVNFYSGQQFEGHFGAGSNFFEIHRNGVFMSKPASKSDIKEFLKLIDRTAR